MKDLLKKNAKAITAALTPVVTFAAAKAGLGLSAADAFGIATALTTVLVWFVPNSYGTG